LNSKTHHVGTSICAVSNTKMFSSYFPSFLLICRRTVGAGRLFTLPKEIRLRVSSKNTCIDPILGCETQHVKCYLKRHADLQMDPVPLGSETRLSKEIRLVNLLIQQKKKKKVTSLSSTLMASLVMRLQFISEAHESITRTTTAMQPTRYRSHF
jgi:hypothetical protein